ncbi:MAG TPA: ATP-binding protein [Candidatus Babeliales bacterium]|nr:ATP-binding protein [Candidatus Babeliales bacterium]
MSIIRSTQKNVLLTMFLIASTINAESAGMPKLETDEWLNRFDHILKNLPQEELLRALAERQKWKTVQAIAKTTETQKPEDSEAHYYSPKFPAELSSEEKKLDVYKRIARKYIGTLPSHVEDLVSYFKYHKECVEQNVSIHNKLLLHGKPGTGKTHLVKVLSQELQIPLLSFSASFFGDKYIGESSRKIRRAFEAAKNLYSPVLVFIDEIDALATKRRDNTHEEHRATLITLLTELQELQDNKNIFFIVATNDLEALDPAVKDRFSGSVCEIKELDKVEKAKLYQKAFLDRGMEIDEEFAQCLAAVTAKEFSNRDVEYIATTTILKRFLDSKKDPEECKNKGLCSYARKSIDSTGKKASFYNILTQTYCDGI